MVGSCEGDTVVKNMMDEVAPSSYSSVSIQNLRQSVVHTFDELKRTDIVIRLGDSHNSLLVATIDTLRFLKSR